MFPDFDDNLRQALQRETEMLFESIVLEDHSVLDLLNADYTFLNERLARHYGIPGIYGDQFRRVAVSDDYRRGLLGQGSILTLNSYANRTSPVHARQVRADQHPRHAAAAAAARTCRRSNEKPGQAAVDARAHGGASQRTRRAPAATS